MQKAFQAFLVLYLAHWSSAVPYSTDDVAFYAKQNQVNDMLLTQRESISKLVDKNVQEVEKLFEEFGSDDLGGGITKKTLLLELEDLRLPEVPHLRLKRQSCTSCCCSLQSQITALTQQLNAVKAQRDKLTTKLADTQAVLKNLDKLQPDAAIFTKDIYWYLQQAWKQTIIDLNDDIRPLTKTIADLQSQLSDLQSKANVACVAAPVTTAPAGPTTPSPCSYVADLYKNGVYLSTACFMSSGRTQASAATKCQSNGMTLFTITTSTEKEELMNLASIKHGSGGGQVFWVSGTIVNNKWVDTNDGVSPLPSASVGLLGTITLTGSCLALTSYLLPFYELLQSDCASSNSYYCKITTPQSAPPPAPVTTAATTAAPTTTAGGPTTTVASEDCNDCVLGTCMFGSISSCSCASDKLKIPCFTTYGFCCQKP